MTSTRHKCLLLLLSVLVCPLHARENVFPDKTDDTGQETATPQDWGAARQDGDTAVAAADVVESLNGALLEAMRRAGELGYKGRYRLLEPVVRRVYDFEAISRHVLGGHWKSLTPQQRKRFIAKMSEYGIASYAAQFDAYGGERFRILAEEPFRQRFRVVKALLDTPNGEDVEFLYILRHTPEGWKIIDVRYDGVSDLALKRGQFARILSDEGFDGLLARLDKKISNYARGDKRRDEG